MKLRTALLVLLSFEEKSKITPKSKNQPAKQCWFDKSSTGYNILVNNSVLLFDGENTIQCAERADH